MRKITVDNTYKSSHVIITSNRAGEGEKKYKVRGEKNQHKALSANTQQNILKMGLLYTSTNISQDTQLEENTWKFPWKTQQKKTMVMEGTLAWFCKHYSDSQSSLQKRQMVTPRNRAPISYEHYKKIKNQWGWETLI